MVIEKIEENSCVFKITISLVENRVYRVGEILQFDDNRWKILAKKVKEFSIKSENVEYTYTIAGETFRDYMFQLKQFFTLIYKKVNNETNN